MALQRVRTTRSYNEIEVERMLKGVQDTAPDLISPTSAASQGNDHSYDTECAWSCRGIESAIHLQCSNPLVESSSQWVSSPVPRSKVLHLASPNRTANASARRCTGPALSQSPARSGHSACMRKIFDEPLTLHRNQKVFYPPLPNISM